MLALFRANNPIAVFGLLLVALVAICGPMLFFDVSEYWPERFGVPSADFRPGNMPEIQSAVNEAGAIEAEPFYIDPLWPFYSPAWNLPSWPGLIPGILTALLIWFQALLFQSALRQEKTFSTTGYRAAAVYVLAAASLQAWFTPALVGMTFLVAAFRRLVPIQPEHDADKALYDVGLFIGLAGLLYLPFTLFVLFGFLAFLILRSPNTRELLLFISGLVTLPILFVVAEFVWNDLNAWWFYRWFYPILDPAKFILELFVPGFIAMLVLLAGLLYTQSRYAKRLIQVRKIIRMASVFLLFALALLLSPEGWIVLALPIAFYGDHLLEDLEEPLAVEAGGWVWLAVIVAAQVIRPQLLAGLGAG